MITTERTALPCPVCTTPSTTSQQLPDVVLYRCSDCDHCWTDPSSVAARETYGPEYYLESHRNWFENPNYPLFDWIAGAIDEHATGRTVLDVGCGRGNLLRHLRRCASDLVLTGLDLNPNKPEDGIRFVPGDVLTADVGGPYDVVTSLATIEHTADVRTFARRLAEFCRPRGTAIVMTLNDRSIFYRMARLLHRLGYTAPCIRLYDAHHLNHFTRTSLRQLLEDAGFEVVATHLHDVPLAALDIPASSRLTSAVLKAGVATTFALGRLTGHTYLQTLVCRGA